MYSYSKLTELEPKDLDMTQCQRHGTASVDDACCRPVG
jgi:hypothetical protein